MAERTDKYANMLYDKVVESGANTLTFNEVNIGLTMFDKVGILISQIHWYNYQTLLAATTDAIQFGLSASNSWTVPDLGNSAIITMHEETVVDYGTAGNNQIFVQPMIDDFSQLPGGGLLITPRPLYLWTLGTNLASASSPIMRMYFTIIKLQPADYFELLESRQFFG